MAYAQNDTMPCWPCCWDAGYGDPHSPTWKLTRCKPARGTGLLSTYSAKAPGFARFPFRNGRQSPWLCGYRPPGERQVFSRVDCSSLRCSESKGLISSCLADGSDPHTVLVPRSLSNPHGIPLAFSLNPCWAVGDAAEWEQNQAGRSSASRSGLRESFARPETAHFNS